MSPDVFKSNIMNSLTLFISYWLFPSLDAMINDTETLPQTSSSLCRTLRSSGVRRSSEGNSLRAWIFYFPSHTLWSPAGHRAVESPSLTNTSAPQTEGRGLGERDGSNAAMTFVLLLEIAALPCCPQQPVKQKILFSLVLVHRWAWELIWLLKRMSVEGEAEQQVSPSSWRTSCFIGYLLRKLSSGKRRFMSGGGLICCMHHPGVCYPVNWPAWSSSQCLKACLKS